MRFSLALFLLAASVLVLASDVAVADHCFVTIIRRLDGCSVYSCDDDCHDKLKNDEQCQETGCTYHRDCEGRHCRCVLCYTAPPARAAGAPAPHASLRAAAAPSPQALTE